MSVFIKYDDWGRMGNRMFQLAFGYILAEQKNVKLYHSGLPNFNIHPSIQEAKPINPIYTKSYGDNYVNMDELLGIDRDIVIDSFVQKSFYYTPYKQKIKKFFNIIPNNINKDKLIMHVRETDYKLINQFLGYEVYKKILEVSGFKTATIVTDNSECDTVKKLINDGCILNSEGIVKTFNPISDARSMNDFDTLLQSDNIALSQSSFSWWAAFLGEHNQIIMPGVNGAGQWKVNPGKDDANLWLYDKNCNQCIIDNP